ncbi:MAG TPA: hypothetical protein VFK05_38085 [Polyangiaceae bacterium]|nr:hypothetical protein [Polyangiaceae bacterium]
MHKWIRWAALIAVGCSARLEVGDRGGGDPGGIGGVGGGAPGVDENAVAGGNAVGGDAGAASVEELAGAAGESNAKGGTAGAAGNVTAIVVPVGPPGSWGATCIPGGLVTEADGTPASAQIRILAWCEDEGSSCDQGKCYSAPECAEGPSGAAGALQTAQTAPNRTCEMWRANVDESFGATGSTVDTSGDTAGTAGAHNLPDASRKTGVVALTASGSHVYWLEYGTRDALGNYQHDGTLLSYSIANRTVAPLVAGLEGPVGLELTASHAYVYIDGAPRLGTPIRPKLLRVPLAGGSAELVQDGTRHRGFTAVGARAIWSTEDQLYSQLPDAVASPLLFASTSALVLANDAKTLFAWNNDSLAYTPLENPVFTAWASDLMSKEFALHDDGVYMLETIDGGGLLSRAPSIGGASVRVRPLGAGTPSQLKVVGDRYFLEVTTASSQQRVLTATFGNDDPPVRLMQRRARHSLIDQLWVGTADALFWSNGRDLFKQPLPAL